jgi:hypothetical protein
MKLIRKVWSQLSLESEEKHFSGKIRKSEPYEVKSFRSLVKIMAKISYHNPEWALFFRGQNSDKKNLSGLTSLFPSIYRSKGGLLAAKFLLKKRFQILMDTEEQLLREFKDEKIDGYEHLKNFREIRWAILQHYHVCKTPLLDLTKSLRVACSFALNNSKGDGYLFVLGLPHINGSISYSVEEQLLNIKLLSICPPKAIRPYYQEGYLAGNFPIIETVRSSKLDPARRLVAKFKLIKNRFWDKDFKAVPEKALMPKYDPMKQVCDRISV